METKQQLISTTCRNCISSMCRDELLMRNAVEGVPLQINRGIFYHNFYNVFPGTTVEISRFAS